jgi:hypothetical protein
MNQKDIHLSENRNQYIPGTCNIGKKEIQRRYLQSTIGFILTIVIIFLIESNHSNNNLKLLIVIPLTYSILCFLQAFYKFCVLFGVKGLYNFNDKRIFTKISYKDYISKDRRRSIWIFFLSVLIGGLLSIAYFLI